MLSIVDDASPDVRGKKLHRFHARSQQAGEAHRTGFYRAEERVPTHRADFGMALLKGIHDHHFRVEIAAEARGEHRVLTSRDDYAPRVDEQGAHSVVPALRCPARLLTDEHAELLIPMRCKLGAHTGKSSF